MEASGKRYIVYGSRKDEFTLWNLADIHMGNAGCDERRLNKDIATIRDDPNAFWVGGGDYADYISPKDKRFDPQSVDKDMRVADLAGHGAYLIGRVANALRPIKHKCLGLIFGNHEDKYQILTEQGNLHGWLCCELGVANLGYSAFVDMAFTRTRATTSSYLALAPPDKRLCTSSTFRVYLHHGAGGAQTPGGKMNRLVKFMDSFDADIYMVGHVHDRIGKSLVQLGANAACNKLVARERVGVVTGSYLKTYEMGCTTYGEKAAYRPVPLGAVYVKINPETRSLRAEI